MRKLFENMDNENQRKKHEYKKNDSVTDSKYTIQDIHYVMMHHLHI